MKKAKIVKEIIGNKIAPLGFKYLKTDGSCHIFIREIKGIKRYYNPEIDVVEQYINIQESNFSKALVVRLSTNAYGYEEECDLPQIVQYGTGGWITYTDEDNYKERLDLLADLILKYAIDLLDEMSVEEAVIPTRCMAEQLFYQHKQLDQVFLKEFHVKNPAEQLHDIDEWFCFIKELILDNAELPYEEVKEILTEIAAFVGERACDILSMEWIFPEHFKIPVIVGKYPCPKLSPLDEVVDLWKYKCDDQHWHIFEKYYRDTLKHGF